MKRLAALFAPLLLTAFFPAGASAVTLQTKILPGSATHLLRYPSEIVTIEGAIVLAEEAQQRWTFDFRQMTTDGTPGGTCKADDRSGCFRIPHNKVLVLTDVEWSMYNLSAGPIWLNLFIQNVHDAGARQPVMSTAGAIEGYAVRGGRWEHLSGGIVISSEGYPLAILEGGAVPEKVFLRGYLAPDK
jgi:hypothetical protein